MVSSKVLNPRKFNFSIVLLAAQVYRNSKVTLNSAGTMIKLPRMFTRNKGYIHVKMMARHWVFVFVSLVFFFFQVF